MAFPDSPQRKDSRIHPWLCHCKGHLALICFFLLLLLSFDMCFTCMTPTHLLEYIPSVCLFLCELPFLLVLNVVSIDEEFSPCVLQLLHSSDTHLGNKTVLELKSFSSFVLKSVTNFSWFCS